MCPTFAPTNSSNLQGSKFNSSSLDSTTYNDYRDGDDENLVLMFGKSNFAPIFLPIQVGCVKKLLQEANRKEGEYTPNMVVLGKKQQTLSARSRPWFTIWRIGKGPFKRKKRNCFFYNKGSSPWSKRLGAKKNEANFSIDSSLHLTIVDDVKLLVLKLINELQGLQKEIKFQGYAINLYASSVKKGEKKLSEVT